MTRLIDRFGVKAVLGRDTLGYGEMALMTYAETAEKLKECYQDRAQYRDEDGNENWVEWAYKNPKKAELLARVMREVMDDG